MAEFYSQLIIAIVSCCGGVIAKSFLDAIAARKAEKKAQPSPVTVARDAERLAWRTEGAYWELRNAALRAGVREKSLPAVPAWLETST